MRRVVAVLAAGALLVAGCTDDEPVTFGDVEPDESAPLPADSGLNIAEVPEPTQPVPSRDAVLEDGGWEETAAWIARENAEGRPVLVNILASWCTPCRVELPLLMETADANPDVAFLGIDHMDRREDAEAFVEEMAISFPTIYDDAGDVAAAVGSRVMPTTVVFDTDGRLAARVFGELSERSLEDLLDAVR